MTQSDSTGFINIQKPSRDLNFANNMLNSVTFELSLSLDVYERQVYSLLDILSDIGGLYGCLRGIFHIIVLFFQFRGDHMFIMKDMFNSEDKSFQKMTPLERQETKIVLEKRNRIQWNCWFVLMANCKIFCPCCCKMSKRERILHKNYQNL